ncbi:MAG: twin-arginine translocase TatA/TatE family subunit [Patescibacteria group bacterium]
MFQSIGSTEIIIIGVIILVFFGGKKLPELTRGIGDAIREFRKAASDNEEKKK